MNKRYKSLRDARFLTRTGARQPNMNRRRSSYLPIFHSMAWTAAVGRCQGSSHKASGAPCQDQVFAMTSDEGVRVICLADGAGSARFSHYGAYLVVTRTAKMMAEKFDRFFTYTQHETPIESLLIGQLQKDLAALSSLGIDPSDEDRARFDLPSRDEELLIPCAVRDLASTLLAVAVKGNRYIALHVGDGIIGYEYLDANRQAHLEVISTPDNGEFANETVFVPSAGALQAVRLYKGLLDTARKHIIGFILMSDGPEASLYHKPSRSLAPACGKLLTACRALPPEEMTVQLKAALEKVIAQKTGDDCSIALLAR